MFVPFFWSEGGQLCQYWNQRPVDSFYLLVGPGHTRCREVMLHSLRLTIFPKTCACFVKQVTTSAVLIVLTAYNQTNQVKASTITNMCLYCFRVEESGPRWSRWKVSKGTSPFSIGCSSPSFLPCFLSAKIAWHATGPPSRLSPSNPVSNTPLSLIARF